MIVWKCADILQLYYRFYPKIANICGWRAAIENGQIDRRARLKKQPRQAGERVRAPSQAAVDN
jgi:hypothetical protein